MCMDAFASYLNSSVARNLYRLLQNTSLTLKGFTSVSLEGIYELYTFHSTEKCSMPMSE